jgi:protein involved in polysaccharide export with SLBB domain
MLSKCSAALILAFLLPVPGSAQEPADPPSTVVLRPGDAVQITVWRKEELSGEFTIAADGTVDHPLYQGVVVAGVPLATARERIRTFLLDWEAEPQLHVKPLFRVAVGGAVQRPNLYSLAPETTISQAVAAAGGVTERGRLNRVQVLRRGEEIVVDLTDVNATALDATVRSGDQIIVGQRSVVVFREYIAPAGTLMVALVSLVNSFRRR